MSNNKIPLSILIGSLIIGIFVYLGLSFGPRLLQVVDPVPNIASPTPSLTPTLSPVATQSPDMSPLPSLIPTLSDEELIKSILIAETIINEADMEFSISENDGLIARGGVRDKNSMSGAMWFAAKVGPKWQVTYIGHGVPECSEVNPYGYPTSWADYCVDELGNTVAR